MNIFARMRRALSDAFRVNLSFLTSAFGDLPEQQSFLESELRALIERDLAILVHKRSKSVGGEAAEPSRWSNDLEAFVTRTVRPKLAGESLLALWNDNALIRMLDGIVANEQNLVLVRASSEKQRLPTTSRFDSHWAS